MRSSLFRNVLVVALCGALVTPAVRAEAPSATKASADNTAAARAHFKTGTRLYQDKNYGGALAEFESAYTLKPGPGSLQNVALCQKALFRYGQAADTLTRLLTLHAAELTDAERSAAERARDELEALVGAVQLVVTPANASVTLDGAPLAPSERSGTLRLNVGEHVLTASAPGYTGVTKTVQVASGERALTVELTLEPSAGAAVPVTAAVASGAPGSAPPPHDSPASTAATVAPPKPALGWYGSGSFSLLATGTTPFRFDLSSAKSAAFGLGVRVGRRVRPAVAVEGMLEYDALTVRHACDQRAGELASTPILCSDPNRIEANYLIRSVRFGPTLALMTTDPRLRALGGIGLGAVWHDLRLGTERSAGVDPYLLLELGVGANTKHVLFSLMGELLLDGTHNMSKGRTVGPDAVHEAAFDGARRTLSFVGVSLRIGYSQWSP